MGMSYFKFSKVIGRGDTSIFLAGLIFVCVVHFNNVQVISHVGIVKLSKILT